MLLTQIIVPFKVHQHFSNYLMYPLNKLEVNGKITRGKARVYVVNSASAYTLPEDKLSLYIKDEISEIQ